MLFAAALRDRKSLKFSLSWVLIGFLWAALPSVAWSTTLGAAEDYAVLGFGVVDMTLSGGGTFVDGNVGVGPGGSIDFSGGGEITGELRLHDGTAPGAPATANVSGGSECNGGPGCTTTALDLQPAVADAFDLASDTSALSGTSLTEISNSTNNNLVGSGGTNIYDVAGDIALSSGTLTLTGGASDLFIFNISGTVTLSGGSDIVLAGGLDASQVLFNVVGIGDRLDFSGDSTTFGTFLAPDRDITVSGGVHEGAFIGSGGYELKLQSGPTVIQNAYVPEPSSALLVSLGLGLLSARRRAGA